MTANKTHLLRFPSVMVLAFALACGGGRDTAASTRASAARPDSAAPKVTSSDSTAAGDSTANVYAFTGPGRLSPAVRNALPRVYVPNSLSASVSVIDPATYSVLKTVRTGKIPQHVVPSHGLDTLWVLNNAANSLTPIDPDAASFGAPVRVDDPYNLYFTPDGAYAIVIAETRQRFDFRDPHTMKLIASLRVPCRGLDHVEFTADQRYAVATCEFSGHVVKIDVVNRSFVGSLQLDPHGRPNESMPQDIRSSPDGKIFYVADMKADGLYEIDPVTLQRVGFLPTGTGAHGITPGRLGRYFYVSNRGWHTVIGGRRGPGSISVLDPATRRIVANWPIPGGGSPDMGNVTADGKELWLSGRYDDEVYVFNTETGALSHRIRVGRQPHGLCVWPQPGRYSLGHTGNMR